MGSMERRKMVGFDFKSMVLVLLGIVLGCSGEEYGLADVSKLEMFVDELPDMPTIHGFQMVDGVPKPKSLDIGMFMKRWKFHRDLPPTRVFAYGTSKRTASVPGPTIQALHGISTHVTWHNHLPSSHILPWDPTIPTAIPRSKKGVPTVVHLHGGIHEPQSDGNSNSWFTNGFNQTGPAWAHRTYHYPNTQHPGNLWYHDHALGLTRVNLLAGLIGAYTIHDPPTESPLGLPHGPMFDRILLVFDRSFQKDGSLYMNRTGNNPDIHPQWQPEYFGDAIIVNGKAWPYLRVGRRKYRFRIINASNARFYNFYFTNGGLGFTHVASDSAYLEKPVTSSRFLLGPSEIADVVVDFSKSGDSTVILANDAAYPYPTGDPVNEEDNGKVMKFIISQERREADRSRPVPYYYHHHHHKPELSSAVCTRYIVMYEYASSTDEPTHLLINGRTYESPATETPRAGTSEVWNVINLTEDNHPVHIHLGLFLVMEQRELVRLEEFKACMEKKNDAVKCEVEKYARGNRTEVVEHEKGWKNVYKTMPGYVTKLLVTFTYLHTNQSYAFDATAEPGYVYHCHILDHEDNAMMRPLKLIK